MKVGFIGFGNMASAIARGWLSADVLAAQNICACAAHYDALCLRAKELGIVPKQTPAEVVADSDIVIVAVKPYMVEELLTPLKDLIEQRMIISLAAGLPFEKLHEFLPDAHIVSLIPNTPIEVGQGIAIVQKENSLTQDQKAQLVTLFEPVSLIVEVDAAHMAIASALAGCSPAYGAMFIEALADAGVKYGLTRKMSYELSAKVLAGTGLLCLEKGILPAALKDAVCSPGGTTIRGVSQLEKDGFRGDIISAIDAVLEK